LLKLKLISVMCTVIANFVFVGFCCAQGKHTKAEVREMFPSNTKDLWINYLSGTIDDKHVVDMIIGTDGSTCKGLYTLRSSHTTFYFDGQDTDQHLRLAELNSDFRMTGYIYGSYNGEIFEGQWMNYDKNLILPLKLEFVSAFEAYQPNTFTNYQWQRIFSGKVDDKSVKLHLTKDQHVYTCYFHDLGQHYQAVFEGKGSRVESLPMNFSQSVLNKKWIVIDSANLDKVDVVYLDEAGYEIITSLKSEAALGYECFEYADYYSRLECIRPLSGNKKFDLWMENTFKSWVQSSVKKLKSTGKEDMATRDRWTQTAHGWVEIDLFLNDIISGTIYMQSSWNHETEKIAFIYDLKTAKEMVLQDIFDNKFDSEEYFRLIIPAKIKEKIWKADEKKWINKQNFNFVTLKDNGISFKTKYSTIFGEKEILVPYSTVTDNLKNKNLLKDLLGK
jgi:hypothetical protein